MTTRESSSSSSSNVGLPETPQEPHPTNRSPLYQIGVMAMTAQSDPHASAEVYRRALIDICNFALKAQSGSGEPPPEPSAPKGFDEFIVTVYERTKDLWSSQFFTYDGAPESMRKTAHEVVKDGLDEILKLIEPFARPIISAEFRKATARARAEEFPCSFSHHTHASREESVQCAIPRRMELGEPSASETKEPMNVESERTARSIDATLNGRMGASATAARVSAEDANQGRVGGLDREGARDSAAIVSLTAGAPHEPSTTETKEAKLIAALRLTRTRDEHSLGCRIKDCTECHRLLDAVVEARCEALGDMLNPVAAVARPVEETKP